MKYQRCKKRRSSRPPFFYVRFQTFTPQIFYLSLRSHTKVKKERTYILALLTAAAFAIAVSFVQVSHEESAPVCAKAIAAADSPEAGVSGGFVPTKPVQLQTLTLPAVFNLRTNIPTSFLVRTFFHLEPVESVPIDAPRSPDVFFEIVFTIFISPNAP